VPPKRTPTMGWGVADVRGQVNDLVARRTARTTEHVGLRQLCCLTLALVPGIHKALSRSVDNQSVPITCVATTKPQISLESLCKCHLSLVRAHCVSIISSRAESVCPYFTNVKWNSSTTQVIPEEAEVLSFQRPVPRRNRQRRAQRSPRSVEHRAGMPGAADSPHLGRYGVLDAACQAPPRPQTKAFRVINQTGLEVLRRLRRCDATASDLPDHSVPSSWSSPAVRSRWHEYFLQLYIVGVTAAPPAWSMLW